QVKLVVGRLAVDKQAGSGAVPAAQFPVVAQHSLGVGEIGRGGDGKGGGLISNVDIPDIDQLFLFVISQILDRLLPTAVDQAGRRRRHVEFSLCIQARQKAVQLVAEVEVGQ